MQGTRNEKGLSEARHAYRTRFGDTFSNQCAKFMLEPVILNSHEYCLDVATGPGTAIYEALCKFDTFPAFAGIDASVDMLHAARTIEEALWADSGLNVEFLQEDVHHLSFADETFDGVFSNLGIHLFSRRTEAISEMKRVLKSGGQLSLTIPYLVPESYDFALPANPDDKIEEWVLNLQDLSGKQNTILGEILDELKAEGFRDVQTSDTILPYPCFGVDEVIGLVKTVLHFSGNLFAPDSIRAFTDLDNALYSASVWGGKGSSAVKLGVTRIWCVK